MVYGEPGLTNDSAIVAGVREALVPGLLTAFPPESYYLSEEAIREAIRARRQVDVIIRFGKRLLSLA
jgi:hypothetical protein